MTDEFAPNGVTVHERGSSLIVSCLPDDPEFSPWSIEVKYIGSTEFGRPRPADQQWIVEHLHGLYLGRDGLWDAPPADGTREWWRSHRFDFYAAVAAARQAAPDVIVSGMTPAEALSWRQQHAGGSGAYAVLAAAQDDEDQAFHDAMRGRRGHGEDGES